MFVTEDNGGKNIYPYVNARGQATAKNVLIKNGAYVGLCC